MATPITEITDAIETVRAIRTEIVEELRLLDHLGATDRIRRQREVLVKHKVNLAVAGAVLTNVVKELRKKETAPLTLEGQLP